jgi:hypothetical protein
MLLLIGGLFSGVLGYKLMGWWAPAAVACVVLALQAVSYQGVLSTADGVSGLVQILLLSGLTSLFLFYATFSLGRSLGSRRRKRR